MAEKFWHFYIANVPNRAMGALMAVLDEFKIQDVAYGRSERRKLPETGDEEQPAATAEGELSEAGVKAVVAEVQISTPTPQASPATPKVEDKKLPRPRARDILEQALKAVMPGEEVKRDVLLKVVREAGMGNGAFDSLRADLVREGWLAPTDEKGVYLRLRRPGEPPVATLTLSSQPPAETGPTQASVPPTPTPPPGFRRVD